MIVARISAPMTPITAEISAIIAAIRTSVRRASDSSSRILSVVTPRRIIPLKKRSSPGSLNTIGL